MYFYYTFIKVFRIYDFEINKDLLVTLNYWNVVNGALVVLWRMYVVISNKNVNFVFTTYLFVVTKIKVKVT